MSQEYNQPGAEQPSMQLESGLRQAQSLHVIQLPDNIHNNINSNPNENNSGVQMFGTDDISPENILKFSAQQASQQTQFPQYPSPSHNSQKPQNTYFQFANQPIQANTSIRQSQINQTMVVQPPPTMNRPAVFSQSQQVYMSQVPQMTPVGNPMADDDAPLNFNAIELERYPEIPTSRAQQLIFCNHCKKVGLSNTVHEPGTGSWIVGCAMFLVLLWPCCIIPCCIDECKDVHHFCSYCSYQLGVKKYLFS